MKGVWAGIHLNITDELIKAYYSTEYRVFAPSGTIVFEGWGCSAELSSLHESFDVNCSAFITAYNPYSDRVKDAVNEKNHARLVLQVSKQWKYLPGEAVALSGEWPVEPSILVPGISLEDALELGRSYQQHAILFVKKDRTRLYACRPENKKYFSKY